MGNILVSVICIAYNHEDYIAKAIDSFLMQKTKFDFEILIHDDASTDRTAEIIRNYELDYPDIIKTIYQSDNKYSKGIKILNEVMLPFAKGKYIAICEGDDFWSYEHKLQVQFDKMESDSNIRLVTHSAYRVNEKGIQIDQPVKPFSQDRILSTEDVLLHAGSMFPTNSYFFKKSDLASIPSFYMLSPVGDRRIVIYLSTLGKISYIGLEMSSYRVLSKGSWSNRVNQNYEMKTTFLKKSIHFFEELNIQTNYIYNNLINDKIRSLSFYVALYTKGLKYSKSIYKDYYKSLKIEKKALLTLKYRYVWIYRTAKLFRSLCNNPKT